MIREKTKHISLHWLLFAFAFTLLLSAGCSQVRRSGSVYTPNSKFDFVAGTKVIWHETFSSNALGDFPKGWNTNAGAGIVEQKNGGRALLLTKDGVYIPAGVNLPQNFTLQFTLSSSANYSYYSSPLQIMFAGLGSKKEFTALKQYNPHNKDVVKLTLHPMNAASKAGASKIELVEKGKKQSENEISTSEFFAGGAPSTVKVSIWRQNERLRVYLNKEKIWDLPQAFSEDLTYNSLVFGISHLVDNTGKYYLSDITLATDATGGLAKGK